MKNVIVFDLDDTLYHEKTFVESGFRAVAIFLAEKYKVDAESSLKFMLEELTYGRGTIFNKLLKANNLDTQKNIAECLSIYRLHTPNIHLDSDAEDCLKRLNMYPKYIITDGNKIVQHNKLLALGLYDRVNKCFITHRFGIKNAKPSPFCMLKICELENANPESIVYIADNPKKDFIQLKPLGFKTIRILKGMYKDLTADEAHNADYIIKSLDEVNKLFLNNIFAL